MNLLIIGISLLASFCAAGLVWYGWAIAENLAVLIKRPSRIQDADGDTPDE